LCFESCMRFHKLILSASLPPTPMKLHSCNLRALLCTACLAVILPFSAAAVAPTNVTDRLE
jgi:hypothetical protein